MNRSLQWRGPVEGTPFRTCLNPKSSLYVDLDAVGYIEEEYFVAGRADARNGAGELVAADQPFHTRCLIRRPAGEPSGTVYIEPFHALDEDTPAWSNSWEYLTRSAHTWIGVTTTTGAFGLDGRAGAGGVARLQRADPARYGHLHLFDPGLVGERVTLGDDGRITASSAAAAELLDQQSASILSQVAHALRARARHVYAFGFSQSGNVWIRFLRTPNDGFDGYVIGVLAAPLERRNDAVVVVLLSEGEMMGTLREPAFAPADTDEPRFRCYEVPGSFHYWTVKSTREVDHGAQHSDKPWQVLYHAMLANMEGWVAGDVPMPSAPRVERDGDVMQRDRDGHAVGGVRAPWIDVPDGRYAARCTCSPVMGAFEPFGSAEMQARYPGGYQAALRRRAGELVDARWLLSDDLPIVLAAGRMKSTD